MELIFELFPFDATVICLNANCQEKVHGVVLIYGIILLVAPLCLFNEATTEYRALLLSVFLLFWAILTLLHAPFKA